MIAFPSPLVFIRNLKITARLVTLSSFLLLLVIGVVLLGHIGLSTQTAQMDTVYRDHTVPLSQLGLGLDGLHRSRMRIVLAMETQYMNTAEEHFAEMGKLQTEALKNLKQAFTQMHDAESQKQIKAFDDNWKTSLESQAKVLKLFREGNRLEALPEFRSNQIPALDAAFDALSALEKNQVKASEQAFRKAETSATRLKATSLLLAAIGLVAAIALSFSIIRSVTGPLSQSLQIAERIAAGDLSCEVHSNRDDETGKLLTALARMQAQLKGMIGAIDHSSGEIVSATGSLHDAYGAIEASAASQTEAAAGIAAAIQQMTAGLDFVSERADRVKGEAEKAFHLSEEGAQLAEDASTEISRVAASVATAAQNIGRLESHSAKIKGIASVIKEIADQTNLLALNAAIEAARAGDQGRGFAVVADEVRKLAEKTGGATNEIMTALGAIHGETEEVGRFIRASSGQVETSVSVIGKLEPALSSLKAGAATTRNEVAELVSSYAEQSTTSHAIAQHIEQIAQMAESSSAAIVDSATHVGELEKLASKLRQAVARFRL